MASVFSQYSLPLRPSISHWTASSYKKDPRNPNPVTNLLGLVRGRASEVPTSVSSGTKHNVLCCKNSEEQHQKQEPCFRVQERCGAKRREFVLQITVTAFSFPAIISHALAESDVPENFRVFTDDVNKFKILIPQDWQVGAGEPNGFKSITAFYPEDTSNSNVSVVITGLGADFTQMESLGKVDAFAETLVNGLDRSWQRPPGVAAKLIDCKAANGIYYIEYSLQNPGESRRHLFTAIGMASNGWYNRLYTVTGQFLEEETEKYSSTIEKAVGSFRFI
ncbi:psbP domain-containing protein 3, chloroplastic [Juglans microcarpa x Juglans regia]|uniref:psbP domain-containing protein 3, chloroplastic n=1 Tax=Juglans microcarpa x Juglans regia TaxID=2249226 RepID=UPI001B7EC7D8|nr:psbP domain-containing protein 3, chloroplastic [Juglans microcarpa x Juglans regia]